MQKYKENKVFQKQGETYLRTRRAQPPVFFCRNTALQFNYKMLVKKNACL